MNKTYREFFQELCQIPHGSGNTGAVSRYCMDFARERGLDAWQDAAGNVVIVKEATAGREQDGGVMLQGHLDMVAVKEPGLDFDFTREPLQLRTQGDYLYAQGTSLGGDDGIAVAMALAVLDADSLSHPRLECVFTTDEEIGMLGAAQLDMSRLTSRYLLNMDSEEEGHLVVSCAGGAHGEVSFPASWQKERQPALLLELTGLTGGHSGTEIHKRRGNAIRLVAELLRGLPGDWSLAAFQGGSADNAIPSTASALVSVRSGEGVEAFLEEKQRQLAEAWGATDPGLCLRWTWQPEEERPVMEKAAGARLLRLIGELPDGPLQFSRDMPDMVELSSNLGVIRTEADGFHFVLAPRSARDEDKEQLKQRIRRLTEEAGASLAFQGDYPGWPLRPDSRLQQLAAQVYREQTGKELVVEGIHAGLECGIFSQKMPQLDIVAFGPDILDIHSTKERLSLSSAERVWNFLTEMLRRIS